MVFPAPTPIGRGSLARLYDGARGRRVPARAPPGRTPARTPARGPGCRAGWPGVGVTAGPPPADEPAAEHAPRAAAATALTFLGVTAFAAGAVLLLWPIWAIGLALVAGGLLVYRP